MPSIFAKLFKSAPAAPSWNVEGKPFTGALLDFYVKETTKAHSDLNEMLGGKAQPLTFPGGIGEAVAGAIASRANQIATTAMQRIGGSIHLPTFPFEQQHIAAGVFGLLVATYMWQHAAGEEVQPELKGVITACLGNFLISHSEEEKESFVSRVWPTYQWVMKEENEGVKKWREAIGNLSYVAVTKSDGDFDSDAAFAKMLSFLSNSLSS